MADSLESFVNAKAEALSDAISNRREETRNWVTIAIIGVYALSVLGIVITGLLIVIGIIGCQGQKDHFDLLKNIVEFLNVLVLPIVTLVLGFYFGTEQKKGA